jgi:trk system potassium uptake protein TrkA
MNMMRCIVIGLGNFGLNIAKTMTENGAEVLGIDADKESVQRAKDFVAHAVIGDASNRAVLASLSLADFDAAVVSIGQEMAASILISLYLKEIGIPRIVVRAVSEDHEKILDMIGASDIIFPEKDMAIRVGMMLSMKNTLDFLPLSRGYAIMEVNAPKSFAGKTLKELAVSSRFGCYIIGIRFHAKGVNIIGSDNVMETKMAPPADEIIPEGSVLIVLGKVSDIDTIQSLD